MFKKPFSFNGRIRRTEFGLSLIIYFVAVNIIAQVATQTELGLTALFAYIPLLWFYLAQASKRCQDRGNLGIFMLIPFYIFWMLFAESDFGVNKYGPNPKGAGNVDEVDEIGNYLPQ